MKNCIMLWKNDAVDLAINNQRRAFSDAYNNEVLAESKIYIELSSKNPLSKLSSLDTVQEARLKIITGQEYMPVDVIGEQV